MAFDRSKAKLSSNVLQMKFMKKSKEKCEKEAEEERRKIMFENEFSDTLIREGNLCRMESSFIPCLQLLNGRFSFRGVNPEIEKLMEENEMKDMEKLKKMDGISNQEMAQRYSTLIGTMKRKFTSKRKWTAENDGDDDVLCCTPLHTSNRTGNV
ncbi:M-phase phosphoprotein 6, partial [Stegodyphus mimosarum]